MGTQLLDFRLIFGFLVILFSATLINKAGDVMYRKGIAKPFYVMGHRLHHRSVLKTVVPAAYAAVAVLIYLHYMRIVWYSFWVSTGVAVLLTGLCLSLDMTMDALIARGKRTGLVHHEWLYLIVPAYVFTHMIVFV